ncbi:MAG: Asp23/Gls24 family envelope stress response protein [Lachnospiraceae bacterium]|nr:Asp23/Gls24 family envelope stress response protein [Lachnospiraceae bacterium]
MSIFQEGISMANSSMNNENGKIQIDDDVIAQYAGMSALECFGIVGMATVSMKDGLVKLLKGDSVSKGVAVTVDEKKRLSINIHIIVAYGVSIATVADNLMQTVRYKVEEFTGMKVDMINVFVEGVRVID